MSLKGKTFTTADLSRGAQRKPNAQAVADALTERNRIVAHDGDRPLIAEELDARALAKLSSKARRIAGQMAMLPVAVRIEVLAAFQDDGTLVRPFTFTKR